MLSATPPSQSTENRAMEDITKLRKSINFDIAPSSRFLLPQTRRYAPQYAHIYFCRLIAIRPSLQKTAKSFFGPPSATLLYASRIVDVAPHQNQDIQTVIMGVVFREMKKPSILAEYDKPSYDLIPAPPDPSTRPYPGEGDIFFLEDENGRCTLDMSSLPTPPHAFVTGYVIAVKGYEHRKTAAFKVSSFTPVLPAPAPTIHPYPHDAYICIVSSLSISTPSFALELFIEFLKGSTTPEDHSFAHNTVALIIAGNLIPHVKATPGHKPLLTGEKEKCASPMVDADRVLSALTTALPVFHMPGKNDPANCLLPQQPIHRSLLPSSSRNSNLKRVANPFACSFEGRHFLATSGQNVTDFALYTSETQNHTASDKVKVELNGDYQPNGENVLAILESMVNNRHIAPTCPDTLGSYPFHERDPFVIETTPHVFVAGNQKEFGWKQISIPLSPNKEGDDAMDVDKEASQTLTLVSVPRFDESGQAVFVNLRDMQCTLREFAMTL